MKYDVSWYYQDGALAGAVRCYTWYDAQSLMEDLQSEGFDATWMYGL